MIRCSARTRSSRSRSTACSSITTGRSTPATATPAGGDYVAAGAGALFLADTSQEAIRQYGPVYDAIVAATNVPGNNTPYRDIDHAVADGPVLVGTAQQVIDKIARFHGRLGHSLQSISLPTTVPFEQQLEILERFATDVIPVLRRELPTTLWTEDDPGARGSRIPAVVGA